MKTLKYILVALLLSINFVSCTPDPIEDYDINTEVISSRGDDIEKNEDLD